MNGGGTRWLSRLSRTAPWCPAHSFYLLAQPCMVRPLSYGSCLLSRVRRRASASSPAQAASEGSRHTAHVGQSEAHSITEEACATHAPLEDDGKLFGRGRIWELKDEEGRTYFVLGNDGGYHCRHSISEEGGHVKAIFTARAITVDPLTNTVKHRGAVRGRSLLIMYSRDLVEDDEFWDEICVLCDWATNVTERDKCVNGYLPEKDSRPVEFIYVQARFHRNANTPDEPWHITVDFGNRQTWDSGKGFLRCGYHIYAKNNDLSQGYAGYSSPMSMYAIGKLVQREDAALWLPWGVREYYRIPRARRNLQHTTHRGLATPTSLPEFLIARQRWHLWKNPATGASERLPRPSIRDELDELLSCIRDGASAPAPQSMGPHMVRGLSGDFVHVREAISEARKAGKEVPRGWLVSQGYYFASKKTTRRSSKAPSTRPAADRAAGATRSSNRSPKGALKPTRMDRVHKTLQSEPQMRDPGGEGLTTPQDRTGAAPARVDGSSVGQKDVKTKGRTPVRAGHAKPSKTKDTTPVSSRTKLTIRDPFDADAAVRQGAPAPVQRALDTSHQETPGGPLEDDTPEDKRRPRATVRRVKASVAVRSVKASVTVRRVKPSVTVRRVKASRGGSDLGNALLNAASEPEEPTHHRQGEPRADKPGPGPVAPSRKRHQGSSLGKALLEAGSPALGAGGSRPPRAPGGLRNGRPGALTGTQKDDSGARKAGGKMGSPLPPAGADLGSGRGKKVKGACKAQRARQTRGSKMTPAWVLPQKLGEVTSDEIRA